jgi:hypothetical protein
MATRRERREWRKEFAALGVRQTADRESRSVWHSTPGKLEEARRWLRRQETRPVVLGATIAGTASITGAIVGALLTAFLGADAAKLSAAIMGVKDEVAAIKDELKQPPRPR